MDTTHLKQQAGEKAGEFAQPNTIIGLGTGSTAIWAVRRIAARHHNGELPGILCIPTSTATENEARALNLPLTTLGDHPHVDLTIDGADEADPHLNLIKGGGGALLREKMVAQASTRNIIVVNDAKLVQQLGTTFALPIEIVAFGWQATQHWLQTLGASVTRRTTPGGQPYLTDQGNPILDCAFPAIEHPHDLARQLEQRAGIVEHGLFLGLATDLIVASESGLRHLQAS